MAHVFSGGDGFDQREGPEFYGSREPCLPVAARPDVLVFETRPLAADVEVTGAIEANLWVSSDGVDTDPTLMTPGLVSAIKVVAFPTSNLIKRGHRIRLDVSSGNFPHFDVNPNTGAPEGAGLARRVARNTVYMDATRPSHVVLPLIPARGA